MKLEDIVSQKQLERCYPAALAVAVYAVCSVWHGPWGAFSLVCLCGLCVSSARLLLSEALQRLRRRRDGQPETAGAARGRALAVTGVLLALLLVQLLVSPDTPWLLASRWYLLLVTPLLAAAFQFIRTPRAELSEALADSQINFAQGSAWGFFLGYLMIRFGHSRGTQGEQDVPSFPKQMSDYLLSQAVDENDQENTCKRRMLILVPMKYEALLSDTDFNDNDESVTKENVSGTYPNVFCM